MTRPTSVAHAIAEAQRVQNRAALRSMQPSGRANDKVKIGGAAHTVFRLRPMTRAVGAALLAIGEDWRRHKHAVAHGLRDLRGQS